MSPRPTGGGDAPAGLAGADVGPDVQIASAGLSPRRLGGSGTVHTERSGPAPVAPQSDRSSSAIVYTALGLSALVLVVFVVLGITGDVMWEIAVPAALGGTLLIGAAALLIQRRSR